MEGSSDAIVANHAYGHADAPMRRLAPAVSTLCPHRDLVVRIVRTELGTSLTLSVFV